jgi:hypothetical protein
MKSLPGAQRWVVLLPPLSGHKLQVRLVAQPLGFGDGELALVDFAETYSLF